MSDSPEIRIRPARREDVPALLRLLSDDPLGRAREISGEPPAPVYFEAFDRIADDARNALAVAEDAEGAVCGCLQITFIPGLSHQGAERALIEDVRVDAALRGRQIGRRLMAWAIAEARRRQCRMVELFSHETRTAAARFYAGLGFERRHHGFRLTL